jgi:hypothetical protein
VAAWMSADTGVGPAIASPSQDCSGNCADLPHAASSSISPMAVSVAVDASPPSMPADTDAKSTEPNVANMSMSAISRPRSPTRLATNAFLAATAYGVRWFQNPINRYEARPTPSQPTNSSRYESARTSSSIAATNRLR